MSGFFSWASSAVSSAASAVVGTVGNRRGRKEENPGTATPDTERKSKRQRTEGGDDSTISNGDLISLPQEAGGSWDRPGSAGEGASEDDEEFHSCEEPNEEEEDDEEAEDTTVRRSIKKLRRFIKRGTRNVLDQCERKKNVVVVGLTGSGKSTLINSMAGCKMRRITAHQANAYDPPLPGDSIVVRGRAYSKIGNTFGESETSLVQPVPLEETILWDAPGFKDSQGAEQNIANAVHLQRLLEASSRPTAQGFVILVVLDAPSLDSGRGGQVKETLEMLTELFGGQQHNGKAALEKNLPGIVFVLTKTTKIEASLDTMRQWVVKLAEKAGIDLSECRDKIIEYNPLCSDDSHKDQLKSLLAAAISIERGQKFCTTLNADDETLLRQIFDECTKSMKAHMSEADADSARRDWALLEDLQVVEHEGVAKLVREVRSIVAVLAQKWKAKVRELHTDLSAGGRQEVRRMLNLLEKNLPIVREVCELDLAQEYWELQEQVKEQEARYQENENSSFRERFSLLRTALWDVLVDIADADVIRMSAESEFGKVAGKEPLLAIKEVQQGRDITAFFSETEKTAEERRLFLYGDQHDVLKLINDQRATIVGEFKGIESEWKLNSDACRHVRTLEKHINHATKDNFVDLSQRQFAVKDVCTLIDLGFDGVAADVRKVASLVEESEKLLSDRKALLRATGEVKTVVNKFLSSLKQRAIHEHTAWKKKVEKLVSQITKILDDEHYEQDAAKLAKALNSLRQCDGSKYAEMIGQIKKKIDKYQSKGELDKLFKLHDFNQIAKRNLTVKKLKKELASHLPDLDEKIVRDHAMVLINHLLEEVRQEINRGDPKDPQYLECTSLRKLTACLKTIRESFGEDADMIDTELRKRVTEKLTQTVQLVKWEVESIGRERMTISSQWNIAKMLVKGYSMATELSMQSKFEDDIKEVLASGLNDAGLSVISDSLFVMAKGRGDNVTEEAAEIAQTIIDHFPQFKEINTQLFNSKAQTVSFEDALKALKSSPNNHDGAALQRVYNKYKFTYDAQSHELARSVKDYSIEGIKERIHTIASALRQQAVPIIQGRVPKCKLQISKHPEEFGELLGLVSASWTYLACMGKPRSQEAQKQPHATQLLGICRLLSLDQDEFDNHLIQIGTGEGKSIALGITAVILALLGLSVDVVCYSRYLCDRDYKEFSGLFKLLDVQDYIRYQDFNSLSSKIMESGVHLPEVRGTFKRFLMGSSRKRSASDKDASDGGRAAASEPGGDFTDHYEVLGLSFDKSPSAPEIKNAYKQLALKYHPDKTGGDDSKFKEINEAYQALSDEKVKEAFDAMYRANVQRESKGRQKQSSKETALARSGPDFATFVHEYERELARMKEQTGISLSKKRGKPPRPSILLVDEVDVFFGNGFFGQPYRPSILIDTDDGDGYKLLRHIWQQRETYQKMGKHDFEIEIMQLPELKTLQKVFPNFKGDILKRELLKILDAVRCFPKGSAPKLSADKQDYKVVQVAESEGGKKIVRYVDPASHEPDPSISYGYVTAFTYTHCQDMGLLSECDVKANVKLQPSCGTFSYSEIPKFYQYCLGMTGTLDCLSKDQKNLLQDYSFKQYTFLPSTFAKQQLNSKQPTEHTQVEVIYGEYDEFFEKIVEDIEGKLQDGRATLIVFADKPKMDRFSAAIGKRNPDHPEYASALELKDGLDLYERTTIVLQAIRRHRVTLMTRAYGRGTDFVCRDAGLVKNGGVHVIMTFLPEDESENKQIEGRTCRQDDPGSARKILFAADLEKEFGIEKIENARANSGKNWDTFLLELRNKHQENKYEKMREQHDETMGKHKETMAACKAVEERKWSEAADLFYKAADFTRLVQQTTTCVEVCFVMDCTSSMASLIMACQETVITIADNIREQCGENMRIRMAFVAYRDYQTGSSLVYDPPGKPEVCPFTEDIDHLRSFVRSQQATGGGDWPEDICGGLREALKLGWQGESRHLFLIADAPCHGSKYHGMPDSDNYPDGDPTNLVPEIQFEALMGALQVNCKFLKLNSHTDKMMAVINGHCKPKVEKEVSEIHLQSGGDSLAKELESLVTSVVVEDVKMHLAS